MTESNVSVAMKKRKQKITKEIDVSIDFKEAKTKAEKEYAKRQKRTQMSGIKKSKIGNIETYSPDFKAA